MEKDNYQYYLKKYEAHKVIPCRYCPGNCITSCPTFIETRNLLLSPLGYVKSRDAAVNYCLKCWRCAFSCPIEYPIPIFIDEQSYGRKRVVSSIEIVIEGEAYLVGEPEYKEDMIRLSKKMELGVKTIDLKYLPSSIDELEESKAMLGYTPEAAFILGIPHFSELLYNWVRDKERAIALHIPCLLIPRKERILSSLKKSGLIIENVISNVCVRTVSKKYELNQVYSLCPRAIKFGALKIESLLLD